MITDETLRQHVYQSILKTPNRRLEQAIPSSWEGAFAHLSLAALLNLFFSCATNGPQSETMARRSALFAQPWTMICYGLTGDRRCVSPRISSVGPLCTDAQ